MDEKEKVQIDQRALIQHLKDKVIIDFMSAIMPDDKTRKLVSSMAEVHRKYGIDAATSMQIMMEIGTMFLEEGKE
jgi:hypothetical protein